MPARRGGPGPGALDARLSHPELHHALRSLRQGLLDAAEDNAEALERIPPRQRKGPWIVEAARALDDILRRMSAHHEKKQSLLRRLRSFGDPVLRT